MIEWLLRKLRRTPPSSFPAAQEEADRALSEARMELVKSEGEAEKAKRVAGALQRVNRENHFAERAWMALRGIVQ